MLKPIASLPNVIELIQGTIETFSGLSTSTQNKIWASFLIILITVALSKITLRILHRYVSDTARHYSFNKTVGYVFTFIAAAMVVRVWFGGLGGVTTYLGLLSAGLAIALQDLIVSLAGWGFIVWRKPFRVGDRIQVGDIKGDVIDIRPFQFSLMELGNWVNAEQSTGRVMHIPNSWTFKQPVANYTIGFRFIWHEMPVVVTFESDWEKARDILLEIVERHGTTLTGTAEQQVRTAARRFRIDY